MKNLHQRIFEVWLEKEYPYYSTIIAFISVVYIAVIIAAVFVLMIYDWEVSIPLALAVGIIYFVLMMANRAFLVYAYDKFNP